jgi:hypothetical protein
MPKREPLYPHIPKSKKAKYEETSARVGEHIKFEWDTGIPREPIIEAEGDIIGEEKWGKELEQLRDYYQVRVTSSSSPLFSLGKVYLIPKEYIKRT